LGFELLSGFVLDFYAILSDLLLAQINVILAPESIDSYFNVVLGSEHH